MRTHRVPIHSAGIAAVEVVVLLQWKGLDIHAEVASEEAVHLMLGQPEGENSGLAGEVVNLKTVELGDANDAAVDELQVAVWLHQLPQLEDAHLQLTQLLVGDDEKVATAAGWVEELHTAHAREQAIAGTDQGTTSIEIMFAPIGTLVEEVVLLTLLVLQLMVFVVQRIHEQRVDDLLDVRYAGVVHPQPAAQFGRDHCLNHRAEDVGVYLRPVQRTALQDEFADAGIHGGNLNHLGKEATVHVGELRPAAVHADAHRHIHGSEGAIEELLQVGAVGTCGVMDGIREEVFLEDARILGKETEQQARHEHVQVVRVGGDTDMVVTAYLIVNLRHLVGGLHVGVILLDITDLAHAP